MSKAVSEEEAIQTLVNHVQGGSGSDDGPPSSSMDSDNKKGPENHVFERVGQIKHQKIDMWAFGLTAIELLQNGMSAWGDSKTEDIIKTLLIYNKVKSEKNLKTLPNHIDPALLAKKQKEPFIEAILKCLNFKVEERPSSKDLFAIKE
jgi:serine/threonine protein kinase